MTNTTGLPMGAVHIAGDTYMVPGLTNSGFVDGLVIDTPPEAECYDGVAIDRLAITHGHADHFAAGSVLREHGATVVAARDDAALVENPDINIRGMFSWAKPGDMLITKLFLGVPCKVDALVEDWRDRRATPVALPGHTLGHTAFLTRDGVLFTGDALYQEPLWSKHPLPYAIDPDMVARSLASIRELEFEWLVPGHGRLANREETLADIDFHLAQIDAIQELLLTELRTPHTTEEAIALVSRRRGLSANPAGYWLAVTTVKGYLGDLLGRGLLEFSVVDHAGVWRTAENPAP
ncbi:MAG: MBL fold metallo-hydrolase [Coriobacteriia bacterium]|nr:MBL fold metallo-hydrolase [Coriobacteriia bacterium]